MSSGDGRTLSGLRVVAGGAAQPWTVTILPSMDVTTMARLPDGRLLVGTRHPADAATGTYTGGGVLCSTDDGVTWTAGC